MATKNYKIHYCRTTESWSNARTKDDDFDKMIKRGYIIKCGIILDDEYSESSSIIFEHSDGVRWNNIGTLAKFISHQDHDKHEMTLNRYLIKDVTNIITEYNSVVMFVLNFEDQWLHLENTILTRFTNIVGDTQQKIHHYTSYVMTLQGYPAEKRNYLINPHFPIGEIKDVNIEELTSGMKPPEYNSINYTTQDCNHIAISGCSCLSYDMTMNSIMAANFTRDNHLDYQMLFLNKLFTKSLKLKDDIIHLRDTTSIIKSRVVSYNLRHSVPSIGARITNVTGPYKVALHVLKNGYRHIDVSFQPNNTMEIGRAIKDSGIPREDITITTVIKSHELKSYMLKELSKQMKKLSIEYVDVLLLGFARDVDYMTCWKLLEKLQRSGVCKLIGVFNFPTGSLEDLLSKCHIIPSFHKMTYEAYLKSNIKDEWHKLRGMNMMLYSWADVNDNHLYVKELSEKYGTTDAYIMAKWAYDHEVHSIVNCDETYYINKKLEENVVLNRDDMAILDKSLDRVIPKRFNFS